MHRAVRRIAAAVMPALYTALKTRPPSRRAVFQEVFRHPHFDSDDSVDCLFPRLSFPTCLQRLGCAPPKIPAIPLSFLPVFTPPPKQKRRQPQTVPPLSTNAA